MSNLIDKISIETDEEVPYTLIENYLLDIEGLSANKKIFFLMLRRYAGHQATMAYPSYGKLMKTCGIKSDDTITKNINFFIWLKFMEKISRKKTNGENDVNKYLIKLKNISAILDHFKKKKISFYDVEKYFDDNYKDREIRKAFLATTCPFLKD